MVKKQRSKSQERKSKRPLLKENSIQIKLEMSRKEINCSFAYACIFHLQCRLHHYQYGVFPLFYCTTPIFICLPLFFCQFQFEVKAISPGPQFQFPAMPGHFSIFQPDQLAASSRFSRFFP